MEFCKFHFMPDFGTGVISSRRTAVDDTNFWYKSDGKWHELNIAPVKSRP